MPPRGRMSQLPEVDTSFLPFFVRDRPEVKKAFGDAVKAGYGLGAADGFSVGFTAGEAAGFTGGFVCASFAFSSILVVVLALRKLLS